MNINNENTLLNLSVTKPIYNITPFTLLDYPDKTACILWFAGCNMRCSYCYNPEIVFGKGKISFSQVLKFLNSRKFLLDGVVLSGGECTLHKGLNLLLQEIKSLGFLVKIDTNGSCPDTLINLIENKLVDYVALDFKSNQNKFAKITQSNLYDNFNTTLNYLIKTNFPFEVRTTVHSELLDEKDIQLMTETLKNKGYTGKYFLQYYVNDTPTIGNMGDSKKNYLNLNNIQSSHEIIIRN